MFLVYVTCGSEKEAEKISEILLKEGLAACANIHESKSIYFWKGKFVKEKEHVLMLKTIEKKYEKLERRIRQLHSYGIPCIIAFKTEKAEKKYARWVEREARSRK